ncbi:MAG: PIG-L family deacetylase [Elusimicrobia bacterium]|nr:PIG-L family deacetylase [Elusimicrobiota bacterium]
MNILVIGPHPDDLEYGCGGTLAKMTHQGHHVHLLIMTGGEMGGQAFVRRREQETSAKLLNAKLYWGRWTDTQVPINKDVIQDIENIIHLVKPTLILVPYYNDTHQDHRNVSQATISATRYARNVLFYEAPTSVDFTPTIFVDIGKYLNKKFSLLRAHKSQVFQTKVTDLSIIENSRSCAIFRGFQNRVKYAEGFAPLRLALDFAL